MKIANFMTRENWTQGAFARDCRGRKTTPHANDAVSWCLEGYSEKLYDYDRHEGIMKRLRNYLGVKYDSDVRRFNDINTFSEVKRVVEELGI